MVLPAYEPKGHDPEEHGKPAYCERHSQGSWIAQGILAYARRRRRTIMKAEAAPLKADIQRFKTDLNKWILILKGVQTVIILGAVIALARMTH